MTPICQKCDPRTEPQMVKNNKNMHLMNPSHPLIILILTVSGQLPNMERMAHTQRMVHTNAKNAWHIQKLRASYNLSNIWLVASAMLPCKLVLASCSIHHSWSYQWAGHETITIGKWRHLRQNVAIWLATRLCMCDIDDQCMMIWAVLCYDFCNYDPALRMFRHICCLATDIGPHIATSGLGDFGCCNWCIPIVHPCCLCQLCFTIMTIFFTFA